MQIFLTSFYLHRKRHFTFIEKHLKERIQKHVCECVCSILTAVCVHLDGLNAEHKFQVWDTILDHTSGPFLYTRKQQKKKI